MTPACSELCVLMRPDAGVFVDDRWSEGALQQTVAAAAGRTLVLPAEPVHHVTGVPAVATAQAEVGRASYRHVADGALEGQVFADGTLSPTSLTATVAAVHPELCREDTDGFSAQRSDNLEGSCRNLSITWSDSHPSTCIVWQKCPWARQTLIAHCVFNFFLRFKIQNNPRGKLPCLVSVASKKKKKKEKLTLLS